MTPTTIPLLFALALASPQQPIDAAAAVRATNEVGISLFRALDKEQPGKNLLFAPLSITVALTMLAEGARDETAAELRLALHLDANAPLADVHAGFQTLFVRYLDGGASKPELRDRLAGLRQQCCASPTPELASALEEFRRKHDLYDFRVGSSVWVDRRFPLAVAFQGSLDRWYGAGSAHALDIAGEPGVARIEINRWVAERTDSVIRELVPEGAIDARTAIVLVNAMLLRADWTSVFSKTSEEDFVLADGKRTKAMLMDASAHFAGYAAFAGDGGYFATPEMVPSDPKDHPPTYPDDDGFTMIELPLDGGDIAMVVIAPRKHDGLPRLEARLDAVALASWLTHLDGRPVDTHMLRFEQRGTFGLRHALQQLGVKRAFTGEAQLDGFTESRAPAGQLQVNGVDHQAWIQVTETGMTAAAVTAIYGSRFGRGTKKLVPFTPMFRADRPFLFLVRDVKSGAILFLGRVTDPRT